MSRFIFLFYDIGHLIAQAIGLAEDIIQEKGILEQHMFGRSFQYEYFSFFGLLPQGIDDIGKRQQRRAILHAISHLGGLDDRILELREFHGCRIPMLIYAILPIFLGNLLE